MNETTLGILFGLIAVVCQIVVCGIRYNKWRPGLIDILSMFITGAMLPSGGILLCFSLFEKPEIDPAKYRVQLAVAGIALLYCGFHGIDRIIKEFKQLTDFYKSICLEN